LIRQEYFADVRQGNLRMFIRSNIHKLPVTTSAFYPRPPQHCGALRHSCVLRSAWRVPR